MKTELFDFEWLQNNLPFKGLEVLALILGLILEILLGQGGTEGMLIASMLTIVVSITFFAGYWQKRWMLRLNYLPVFGISLVLSFYHVQFVRVRWQDWRYSFDENEKGIKVLISDFASEPPAVGKEFTDRFFNDFVSRVRAAERIEINGKNYIIRIHPKRTNKIENKDEMYTRGKRRRADLGVVGIYGRYYEVGFIREYVTNLQCVIVNDSLATVLESKEPLDELYEFNVRPGDVLTMVEKVSNPIHYIIGVAVNLQLLKIASREKNVEQRRKLLKRVNDGFAEITSLLGSRAISAFHQGNSYFRNAQASTEHDPIELFQRAVDAYHESIAFEQKESHPKILSYDAARPYYNLATTFRKIHSLTAQEAWLDSAETTYEQAANTLHTYETTQELVSFLDECLENNYQQHGIPNSMFDARVEKYLQWSHVLIEIVMASSKTMKEKNEERKAINDNCEKWIARRRFY